MEPAHPPEQVALPIGMTALAQRDGDGCWVYAIIDRDGREVGAAVLSAGRSSGCFTDIWIAPHLRRKGVATALYDAVEESGIALSPSAELDEDGALFWEGRIAARADGLRSG